MYSLQIAMLLLMCGSVHSDASKTRSLLIQLTLGLFLRMIHFIEMKEAALKMPDIYSVIQDDKNVRFHTKIIIMYYRAGKPPKMLL